MVAGPLFLAVYLAQAVTRAGFDPTYHPLSLLSLGRLGFIQVANFVVAGLLYLACAVGLRRAGQGRLVPILVAVNGIGLVVAGVFPTDAGAGFPPGAPAGAPDGFSGHAIAHEVGFAAAMLSWLVLCVVLLRRFRAARRWGWVLFCGAAPVAVLVLAGWPDLDGLSVRLVFGSAVSFGFVAALAADLSRLGPSGAPRPVAR
jgi:hypothetical membrane protein